MPQSGRMELRKFVAPEFVFGDGALNLVGDYCANFGAEKVLLVTDPGVRQAGWTGRVEAELEGHGIPFVVFDEITSNPKDHETMVGADYYQSEKCDLILSVGGGSPMDCAKGIGIVSTNHRHILEFEGVDEVRVPGPPLICIPTTAGSSADVSQFAIITDTSRHLKIAVISKTMVPDVALIDPATTATMPAGLTAATGMDALVHAFEAYVSNAGSPLTDLHALEAIRLIAVHLPLAMADQANLIYRDRMMLASLQAGLAFSNASLGLVHGMAHSLGGALDLAHGDCNSILLEHVVGFNFDSSVDRYRDIAQAMGVRTEGLDEPSLAAALLKAVAALRTRVGITQTLSDLGVKPTDIPQLARNALNDPCLATNPKPITAEEIGFLYEKAL